MDIEKAFDLADNSQETVCEIDTELRVINIPASLKLLGVESDDAAKVIHFKMKDIFEDSDVQLYVNYMNANGDKDVYVVTDKEISDGTITFSWLVGRSAAKYKGKTHFIVCAKKVSEDVIVLYEWNTTLATLPVLEGLEADEESQEYAYDIFATADWNCERIPGDCESGKGTSRTGYRCIC